MRQEGIEQFNNGSLPPPPKMGTVLTGDRNQRKKARSEENSPPELPQ